MESCLFCGGRGDVGSFDFLKRQKQSPPANHLPMTTVETVLTVGNIIAVSPPSCSRPALLPPSLPPTPAATFPAASAASAAVECIALAWCFWPSSTSSSWRCCSGSHGDCTCGGGCRSGMAATPVPNASPLPSPVPPSGLWLASLVVAAVRWRRFRGSDKEQGHHQSAGKGAFRAKGGGGYAGRQPIGRQSRGGQGTDRCLWRGKYKRGVSRLPQNAMQPFQELTLLSVRFVGAA